MSVATPEPSMPSRLSRRPAVSMIRRRVTSLCSFPYRTTPCAPSEVLPRLAFDASTTILGILHHRDDDLARLRPSLLDMGDRLERPVEREGPVDDRAQFPLVVQGAELTQLGTVGLHEEELVAHASGP